MPEAYRARRLITLAGEKPARGLDALDAPLAVLEDAVLIVRQGTVEAVEPYSQFRRRAQAGIELTDLGEVCLAPGLVNAHCHLELSHLRGKTARAGGFARWLDSLISLVAQSPGDAALRAAIAGALQETVDSGVAHVGDVGSRNPSLVSSLAERSAEERGVPYPVTHFLEAFGFSPPRESLPDTLSAEGYAPAAAASITAPRRAHCSVAGHALYSTSREALRAAAYWCWERGRIFSLHLAESEEEEECLREGRGALYDIFAEKVLPRDWRAPGLSSLACASRLHLLGPFTLAVHCVQCDEEAVERLALTCTNVCLCPRSNAYIGVGLAPGRAMAEAGVMLCLGTDGLSSNDDLDMRREMIAARDSYGLSARAVLRMATVNGAYALGLAHLGALTPGKAAVFAVLDEALARDIH